jgi:hypothetical protein
MMSAPPTWDLGLRYDFGEKWRLSDPGPILDGILSLSGDRLFATSAWFLSSVQRLPYLQNGTSSKWSKSVELPLTASLQRCKRDLLSGGESCSHRVMFHGKKKYATD